MSKTIHQFETEKARVELKDDHIAIIDFKDNSDIYKKDVVQIQEKLSRIVSDKKIGVLVKSGENTTNDPESRAYSASKEGSKYSASRAILVNSFSQRLIARLYINYHKPVTPTRFFKDEMKAIEWLKMYI